MCRRICSICINDPTKTDKRFLSSSWTEAIMSLRVIQAQCALGSGPLDCWDKLKVCDVVICQLQCKFVTLRGNKSETFIMSGWTHFCRIIYSSLQQQTVTGNVVLTSWCNWNLAVVCAQLQELKLWRCNEPDVICLCCVACVLQLLSVVWNLLPSFEPVCWAVESREDSCSAGTSSWVIWVACTTARHACWAACRFWWHFSGIQYF